MDRELSGVISLLFVIRNAKGKGGRRVPELSGVIFLLFLIRNPKKK